MTASEALHSNQTLGRSAEVSLLACAGCFRQIQGAMASPILDFSHLTPDERIELAEQLWDSLEPEALSPTDGQVTELRCRRAELEADGEPGEPWQAVLKEISERGA